MVFTEAETGGCTIDYQLTQTDMAAGTYDTNIFTLTTTTDPPTNTISINTIDYSYDLSVIELTFTASTPQNTQSTPISTTWTVYIQNECWSADLTAPVIAPYTTFDLWDDHFITIPQDQVTF